MTQKERFSPLDILLLSTGLVGVICGLGIFIWFIARVGPIALDGDPLYEFFDWTKGESLWRRLFHNGVASWPQSLGLMLDAYIGPYAYWSRLIAFGFLAAFCFMFTSLTKSLSSWPVAIAFIGLFLLFWFQASNGAQAFWYTWRAIEATCQLVVVSCFAFLIYHQNNLKTGSFFILLLAAFIASTVHIGYVLFLSGLLVATYAERDRNRKIAMLILLVVYVIYMFTLDGTFADLWKRFTATDGDKPRDLSGMGVAVLGLSTQFAGDVSEKLVGESSKLVGHGVMSVAIVGTSLYALYKAIWLQDRASMVFIYVVGASYGALILIVLGRFDRFGLDIISVPRYFSYSLVIFFILIWFMVAHLPKRTVAAPILLLLGLGLWLSPNTVEKLGFHIRSSHFAHSADYSIWLNQDYDEPVPGVPERRRNVIKQIMPILAAKKIPGFGDTLANRAAIFDPKPLETLPVCASGIGVQLADSRTGYHRVDYRQPRGDQPIGYGIVSSGRKPVAAARMTYDKRVEMLRLFVPQTEEEPILFVATKGANPEFVCQKPIIYPVE